MNCLKLSSSHCKQENNTSTPQNGQISLHELKCVIVICYKIFTIRHLKEWSRWFFNTIVWSLHCLQRVNMKAICHAANVPHIGPWHIKSICWFMISFQTSTSVRNYCVPHALNSGVMYAKGMLCPFPTAEKCTHIECSGQYHILSAPGL